MTALITSLGHALATAASDTVRVAKFAETSVLPALKTAQANSPTIEAVTSLVSPQAANVERAGFAVLGVVINPIDALEPPPVRVGSTTMAAGRPGAPLNQAWSRVRVDLG